MPTSKTPTEPTANPTQPSQPQPENQHQDDQGMDQNSVQDKDRFARKPGTPEAGESRTIREGST